MCYVIVVERVHRSVVGQIGFFFFYFCSRRRFCLYSAEGRGARHLVERAGGRRLTCRPHATPAGLHTISRPTDRRIGDTKAVKTRRRGTRRKPRRRRNERRGKTAKNRWADDAIICAGTDARRRPTTVSILMMMMHTAVAAFFSHLVFKPTALRV